MHWLEKAWIGAAGGLALVLLKLINVGFLLHEPSSAAVLAAYLTYGSYVLLGVLVALYFTDESIELYKQKRSAFISGLLAPSLLLAVVNQGPNLTTAKPQPIVIPKIGYSVISPSFAQDSKAPDVVQKWSEMVGTKPDIIFFKRSDIEYSFSDGVWLALGRPKAKPSIYVLGQANDQKKAAEYAENINEILRYKKVPTDAKANVIQPIGYRTFYVTIGKPADAGQLEALKKYVNSAAISTLSSSASPEDKLLATSMLEGQIVTGSALFVVDDPYQKGKR